MRERLIFELKAGDITQRLFGKEGGDHEVFADGIHGLAVTGTHVKFNLFTVEFTDEPNVERRCVACRVVMSLGAFFSVADFLTERAKEIRVQLEEAMKQS